MSAGTGRRITATKCETSERPQHNGGYLRHRVARESNDNNGGRKRN
jgi:hypothetical protein